MKKDLSVVLATYNEEANLPDCLDSVKDIASEIIIVDGESTDRTVEIAKSFGAKVHVTENHPIFHINKQKAIEMATGDWILQLDADERVSKKLAREIEDVIAMSVEERSEYEEKLVKKELFDRHTRLLSRRDGEIGEGTGEYVAFFVPRLNFFLGRYLRYGGVYPDGVIRLFKNGKAYLPAKDVHEQMVVRGRVGWLSEDLYHIDSPTFARYLQRNKRYIHLLAEELRQKKDARGVTGAVRYGFYQPVSWFLTTFFRHKGFLDSWQGLVFSFFSALRFPRAYIQMLRSDKITS